jgi:hypothetical protein
MADKRKRRSDKKHSTYETHLEETLDGILRINRKLVTSAIRNARRLAQAVGDDAEHGNGVGLGKRAKAFLWGCKFLLDVMKYGDKEVAIQAAMFLGVSAFSLVPVGKDRTIREVLNAYEGHRKGGQGTKLFNIEVGDHSRTLKEVLEKCRTGKRHNYKEVAAQLYRGNIKGRGGKKISTKTIARLRQELEEKAQR